MKLTFECRYRPAHDAPWQEFVLHAEEPAAVLDRIQRRSHPERTEQDWQRLEEATDKRLAEISRRREEQEREQQRAAAAAAAKRD